MKIIVHPIDEQTSLPDWGMDIEWDEGVKYRIIEVVRDNMGSCIYVKNKDDGKEYAVDGKELFQGDIPGDFEELPEEVKRRYCETEPETAPGGPRGTSTTPSSSSGSEGS